MDVTFVLIASIILQFTAAFLALRLIRLTGKYVAWSLIGLAIFFMGVRRCITLFRMLSGDLVFTPDLSAELVALTISILMVLGIAFIGPLFCSIKRLEEGLRQSEKDYKELANSITDVFFAFDSDLRYTYWNRASEELTGISAKDALGKHLYDIFPKSEQTRIAEKAYLEVLATRQPQYFINEYTLRDKNFIFEISAYPSESGLSVFTKDITERRRAENERHNRALDAIDGLAGAIDKFLTKYRLQEHTTDFRLIFKNIAVTRLDLIGVKVKSITIARIAKDIRGKDFFPLLNEVGSNLEELRNVLSVSTINSKVIGNCVDKLRDSHKILLEALSIIKHK